MGEKNSNVKIDFVLPWVDGNDPEWKAQKDYAFKHYQPIHYKEDDANEECRYREMGLLRYWFRSVEKFAPWVNKVFFVTCGQKPEWLNEKHPKLELINHEDYMPSAYLPTFNANPIELNFHRISTLSEQFVYFNDDIFLLKPISPVLFFKNANPVLPCNLNINRFFVNNNISKKCFNDFCTVNEHFDIKKSIWENRGKWFSISNLGIKEALMNLIRYKINKTFFVDNFEHLAVPHLKSTIQEVWDKCQDILDESSNSRFRSDIQVNQWLMLAWNLAKGQFYPIRVGKRGIRFPICSNTIDNIVNTIKHQSVPQICVNDCGANDNPEFYFTQIRQAFECILPEKSFFEK
jgi:hypothetical protein